VLIVEDHDPLRQILTELVRDRGYRAFATDRGPAALGIARREKLDIGILDMHLPGITGLELFQIIRQEIGPLPAIMMSGEATATETDAALNAGVFSFLRKPIAIEHLQRSLDLLVDHHFPHSPDGPPGGPLR
jgi:DNA-binding response OmpR family regulator